MATNMALDDKLINDALKLGGYKTKKDTVNQALREFIQRRQVQELANAFGTIDFDQKYDYKKQREQDD